MCGIFGSKSVDSFKKLASLNSYRGSHSWSYTSFTGRQLTPVEKGFGNFPTEGYFQGNSWLRIGHVQAPTTEARDINSIHPASLGNARLWHNGIIKDHIVKEWLQESSIKSKWDTYLLLERLRDHGLKSLSDADGSFACCYYDGTELYLFRNDNSPLFVNGPDFSSVKFKESVELPAGVVYNYKNSEWVATDISFKTANTYYWSFE